MKVIKTETYNALITYLSSRPWREANPLIVALADAKDLEDHPAPREPAAQTGGKDDD